MNWALAIGFELGAAASLAAIIILEKTNRTMVWALFLLLTSFQMMANSFHAYINLEDYMGWIELFGLQEEEPIFQKRVLSVISGAVLPLVALGFIKSLVDYVRPEKVKAPEINQAEEYFKERDQIFTEKTQKAEKERKDKETFGDNEDIDLASPTEDSDGIEYDSEGNIIIPPLTVNRESDSLIREKHNVPASRIEIRKPNIPPTDSLSGSGHKPRV